MGDGPGMRRARGLSFKVRKRLDDAHLWGGRGIGRPMSESFRDMQRTAPAGYDDFVLWAEAQATALREGRFDELDMPHLLEEIDDLSGSLRREIHSRLRQIGAHILKFQHQPERASSSWSDTIIEQAEAIEDVLEGSPSLRRELPGFISRAYPRARRLASRETKLPLATFPEAPTAEFERALQAALAGEDFGF
jgi:hypothetical protein